MDKLQICLAFAALEGVQTVIHRGEPWRADPRGDLSIDGTNHSKYDPVDGDALQLKARDDYRAEIDYSAQSVFITNPSNKSLVLARVTYWDSTRLGLAVIECILTSKGKL